jgi:class 3 adenylate cyclase
VVQAKQLISIEFGIIFVMSTLHQPLGNIGRLRIEEIMKKIRWAVSKEVSFSESPKSYCVGTVDVVDSTNITAYLKDAKMCEYYGIFLNTMSEIAKEFGAVIVKNIGDSLLYYFPDTSDAKDSNSLYHVLECGIAMVESYSDINKIMLEHGLPPVNYRISSDYGKIYIARSSSSSRDDIFGPTVSICSKINRLAMTNGIVIGGDLYQIVRSFKEYVFHSLSGFSVGMRLDYPVYSLCKRLS